VDESEEGKKRQKFLDQLTPKSNQLLNFILM